MSTRKLAWPISAIFYDSKTTLFDWSWTWKQAAARLVEKYQTRMTAQEFLEGWRIHRRMLGRETLVAAENIAMPSVLYSSRKAQR